jgi:hypothetical protein
MFCRSLFVLFSFFFAKYEKCVVTTLLGIWMSNSSLVIPLDLTMIGIISYWVDKVHQHQICISFTVGGGACNLWNGIFVTSTTSQVDENQMD